MKARRRRTDRSSGLAASSRSRCQLAAKESRACSASRALASWYVLSFTPPAWALSRLPSNSVNCCRRFSHSPRVQPANRLRRAHLQTGSHLQAQGQSLQAALRLPPIVYGPGARSAVLGAGQEGLAVRQERRGQDGPLLQHDRAERPVRDPVPEPGAAVAAAGQQPPTFRVGAEGHHVDALGVLHSAPTGLPDRSHRPRRAVGAARQDQLAVGAEGRRVHFGLLAQR